MNAMTPSPAAASSGPATRRVVDAPTRVFHWLFALSFVGAYLTAEGERWRMLHVTLGYTLAGLLVFRVVYGLVGPRQARLSLLWRKLAGLPRWLAAAASLQAVDGRQAQNLAMALAVVGLLVLALPLTLSGYASYSDWGDGLGEAHEFLGNAFLALVLGHLALMLILGLLRRKNVARNMLTGRVEGPGPDLAKRNHALLAVLLLVAVLAFWAWQWQQAPNGLVAGQDGSVIRTEHDAD
ncbi:cytochrome b/b6 domain-containing protein [Rhodoferax sp. WC2427]|uniref:cytochrome b/b6 domain-containing protein n=1 Tax=Rhodoferax sp. WC2427 TaxID=3234144 RepID=UPI003466CFBF